MAIDSSGAGREPRAKPTGPHAKKASKTVLSVFEAFRLYERGSRCVFRTGRRISAGRTLRRKTVSGSN
ncbi:hypothetical protein CDO73_17650 [Saccharibacillus sp. O23]|uniref:hypothetical protein n=1 Tax=Saccharibacillus sp. O23 TaxID=2009338 RepID=UPI000B4DFA45|nr:hypothetical protein [Saccharibacillus sp. O23]OWR28723.1 hypothetical protein CDO73_17650 [Saccharibacillus sp. O23]